MTSLSISDYAKEILLYDDFEAALPLLDPDDKNLIVEQLLHELEAVLSQLGVDDYTVQDAQTKRALLDAAITVLPPNTLSDTSVEKLNQLLQSELNTRELFHADELAKKPFLSIGGTKVVLWRSDITTLKVDAIVNAANSQMLGCFQPMHKCIDNAIHNRAGVQLRSDCQTIMNMQGSHEPTGTAKVTRAYNLPSNYVIHTVGPITQGAVTPQDESLLAACYTSILEVADTVREIKSIAFCAISTGVFGYPIEQATPLAVNTVIEWLKTHPNQLDTVIFNVFSARDHYIYQSVLEDMVGD